jgi:hypothetical protein
MASVEPSFDPSWVIGAVHEELWTAGPSPDWVAVRGFVADVEGAAVAPLEVDAALEAFGQLNPFRVEPAYRTKFVNVDIWFESAITDGLGYAVRWETKAVRRGAFAFSNPVAAWLLPFERLLFRFAQQVVSGSGATRFENQLRCWAEYRDAVRNAEQSATADRPRD